jgi:GT2 family glycosyltransferase
VESVLAQSRPPSRILVVDQSENPIRERLQQIVGEHGVPLTYLHVYPDSGLVRAKRKVVESFQEELVCFLEDDVILDRIFLEELGKTFIARPDALGVGGICRNSPGKNMVYVLLHKIFYQGVFRDSRPWITFQAGLGGGPPIPSTVLSGGISAYRQKVLKAIPFVPEEGFHMMEDMHFSRKVTERFGPCLWINPQATLQHFPAKEGRARLGEFEKRRLEEVLKFYHYHQKGFFDSLSFFWLVVGLTIFSLLKSCIFGSLKPLTGHARGISSLRIFLRIHKS